MNAPPPRPEPSMPDDATAEELDETSEPAPESERASEYKPAPEPERCDAEPSNADAVERGPEYGRERPDDELSDPVAADHGPETAETEPSVTDTGTGTDADPDPDTDATSVKPVANWRRPLLLLAVALAVLVVDIVSKLIVVATIDRGENVRILGGAVYLTQIRNPGAAFSMATGMTWLLALVAAGVAVFIVVMAPRLRSTPWAVCLGLILGGALGNLMDRIFREPGFLRGHVVDFVSLFGPSAEYFPAFNAADAGITVGGVLLVIFALFGYDFDGTRHRRGKSRSDG